LTASTESWARHQRGDDRIARSVEFLPYRLVRGLGVDSEAMDVLAILGLAGLILVKEAGVPLPVPGDLVIIGAGASLAGDLPGAGLVLAVILVAGFIGACIQFLLFGSALRRPLLAALERLGIGKQRLQGLSDRFRRAGARAVAVTRITPVSGSR
jgi:membrane protein DedA with SNARE-associated domain